jgi:hypothetical protein
VTDKGEGAVFFHARPSPLMSVESYRLVSGVDS